MRESKKGCIKNCQVLKEMGNDAIIFQFQKVFLENQEIYNQNI